MEGEVGKEGRRAADGWPSGYSGVGRQPYPPVHTMLMSSAQLGWTGAPGRGQILEAPSKPVVAGSLCGVCIWTNAWQVGRY